MVKEVFNRVHMSVSLGSLYRESHTTTRLIYITTTANAYNSYESLISYLLLGCEVPHNTNSLQFYQEHGSPQREI